MRLGAILSVKYATYEQISVYGRRISQRNMVSQATLTIAFSNILYSLQLNDNEFKILNGNYRAKSCSRQFNLVGKN